MDFTLNISSNPKKNNSEILKKKLKYQKFKDSWTIYKMWSGKLNLSFKLRSFCSSELKIFMCNVHVNKSCLNLQWFCIISTYVVVLFDYNNKITPF